MWILVLMLDFLGPKKFLRFLAGSMLIMLFFLYCFVHEAFDQPTTNATRGCPHTTLALARADSGPLAPTLDRSQCLFDGPFHVIVLPPLVPFM